MRRDGEKADRTPGKQSAASGIAAVSAASFNVGFPSCVARAGETPAIPTCPLHATQVAAHGAMLIWRARVCDTLDADSVALAWKAAIPVRATAVICLRSDLGTENQPKKHDAQEDNRQQNAADICARQIGPIHFMPDVHAIAVDALSRLAFTPPRCRPGSCARDRSPRSARRRLARRERRNAGRK
jgi:hypothetical protein